MIKKYLLGASQEELEIIFEKAKQPRFRVKQFVDWMYAKAENDLSRMTSFPAAFREEFSKTYGITSLTLAERQSSKDNQTIKFLFTLVDGKKVESVLICSDSRRTLCVSCSVGCPARCAFCASGKFGLIRQLALEEILGQFLLVQKELKQQGETLSHVVFMGMGEPFENYEAVKAAVTTLISPTAFNISQRRITISTVGVIEGIEKLLQEPFRVNLALSLHAPTQEKRQRIIPYARKYPLEKLLQAMQRYQEETRRDITYEYTLIDGYNDSEEDAHLLVQLVKRQQCTVNLIPYNPIEGVDFKTPHSEKVAAFHALLERAGIPVTWRYRKGDDIAAACGQLALRAQDD